MKTIIFDIDWTIANCEHRLHLIKEQDPKDYIKFYMNCDKDEPISQVIEILERFNENRKYDLALITWRSEICSEKTRDWIENETGIKPAEYTLYMRDFDDHRPAHEVKKEVIKEYFDVKEIHAIFEDCPKCVAMYRELWLFVFDVNHRTDND